MGTRREKQKSLAPLSKEAGEEKRRQIREMREAALKSKDDGKVRVK